MIKIKVPRGIKIGAFDYKVKFTNFLKSDEGWRASCNQRRALIEVDPAGGDTINRSFLHEIIHLIDFSYECNLDEANTSRIANGLAEFLERNLNIELDWSDIHGNTE